MEKYITKGSKAFAIMAVLVMGMFITNNHFHSIEKYEPNITLVKALPMPNIKVAPLFDPLQLECLAKNIYYESRGESVKGQIAVARVVMNRVKHHAFGSTPCKVINQVNFIDIINEEGETKKVKACQFSWVCDTKIPLNKNSPQYKQAVQIAHDVLVHDAHSDLLPRNTLFFHYVGVNPNWGYKQVAVIGNHIFYAKGR
jgi:spore germination cell wall hydrolase CwlJ-like protein